jgi:hypothetical protein
VSGRRIDVSPEESLWLRGVLLGEGADREVRLLARVDGSRVLHAVRSDTGPLMELPAELEAAIPRGLWSLPGVDGVDRVVALGPARAASGRAPELLERLLERSLLADPPWCPAFDALRPLFERLGSLMLQDGAYLLASPPSPSGSGGWRVACARLRAGGIDLICGASALGLDAGASRGELAAAVRRQVGAPRLILLGPPPQLRALATSRRPITALERATIRGEVEIVHRSPRLALALQGIRLCEPLLDRARERAQARSTAPARERAERSETTSAA